MVPLEFHEIYHARDVEKIPRYPKHYYLKWLEEFPIFNGDTHCVIFHIAAFLQYASKINSMHENVLMKLFVASVKGDQRA